MKTIKFKHTWWWIIFLLALALIVLHYRPHKDDLQLTADEQQWLHEHQTIHISPNPNFAPLEFFEKDSSYTGLVAEIITLVEQRLNIKFQIVRYPSQFDIYNAIQKQETDVLPAVIISPKRRMFLLFSQPIIELQNVIVVRKNDQRVFTRKALSDKRIALVKGSSVYEELIRELSAAQIDTVFSGLESLYEVSFGRADAAIVNLASASYLIENRGLANLRVAGDYSSKHPISIAIRKDWPTFVSIVNKTLNSIPKEQYDEKIHRWLGLQIEEPWFNKIPWQWIAITLSFIGLIVTAILMWNRTLKHQVKEKTIELQQELDERRKIENISRESEEKFKRLFDLSPVGAVMVGLDFKYIRCNDAFYQFIGYSEKELAGKTFLDVTHPDDKEIGSSEIQALLNGTIEQAQVQKRYRRKDGILLWGEVTMRLMFGENGVPLYFLTIILDITERKRADENIQHRTKELSALHNIEQLVNASLSLEDVTRAALHGITSAVDVDLAFLFLREGDKLLLQGIAPEQAKGVMEIIPEHRVGECMCGLAVRERTPIYSSDIFHDFRCTWEECKKAGLHSFAALPLLSGNEVIGVLGLSSYKKHDYEHSSAFLETLAGAISIGMKNAQLFSTTRQAEEALRKREEELQSVFRASPIGIGVTINRSIQTVNDRLCDMTGYHREELLQQNIRILYPTDEEYEIASKELYRQIAEKGIATVETRCRKKDGTTFDLFLSLTPIHAAQDQPRLIFTALDITERKQLALQLTESQKMESLGTLAGGIAHDFNNLLNIIMGYAGLLEKYSTNPEKFKHSIESILKAGERATGLVRQILTFARRTEFQKTPFNINDLINELVSMLHETFPRTIQIDTDLYRFLSPILGDRNQIHQALLNLAVNARDAMPSGGTILFHTELMEYEKVKQRFPTATNGNYICLRVQDTGSGIDELTLKRIFEPFFTTKEHGKGTGLGLSVVYGIVTSMGGFIDVKSEVGLGTTFFLYLPAITVEPFIKVDEPKTQEIKGGNETILVVEDEEATRDLLMGGLETKGYHVLNAEDGEAAIKMYANNPSKIDLVLSDLGLPKMNGYECYREMKRINPGVKMILASGFYDPVEKAKMEESGIRLFVQKPYRLDRIFIGIRKVLDEDIPPQ
jgi:two-component system, cell cycle sensor histidine kinase and response regulator CckA